MGGGLQRWMDGLAAVYARPLLGPSLVFALGFVLLWGTAATAPPRNLAFFDQPFYATTAWELLEHGVYGDGVFDRTDGKHEAPRPGIFLPPAWPLTLTGLMWLDPALREAGRCLVVADQPLACPAYLGPVPAVQMAFVAGALAFFFAGARRFIGPLLAAAATAIAFALLWRYTGVLRLAMTEALALLSFAASLFLFTRASRGSLLAAALCGGTLALLTLTRPSHILLVALACLAILFAPMLMRRRLSLCLGIALGAAAVLAPWALRNHQQLGQLALSGGYGGATMTERLAWNAMTGRDWAVSFLYNLPDAGNGLADGLFGREVTRRLDWNDPDSFYVAGIASRRAMNDSATGPASFGEVLRAVPFEGWLWHAFTTASLAWRGVWIGRSLALFSLPLLVLGVVALLRRPDAVRVLIWLAPAWIMLAAHAALAVNQERYNLALAFPWAFCVAVGAAALLTRLRPRAAPTTKL